MRAPNTKQRLFVSATASEETAASSIAEQLRRKVVAPGSSLRKAGATPEAVEAEARRLDAQVKVDYAPKTMIGGGRRTAAVVRFSDGSAYRLANDTVVPPVGKE